MKMKGYFGLGVWALLAAAMVSGAACGGGGAGPAGDANILKRGTASEPPSIDPPLAQGNSSSALIDDLFIGLTTTDAEGQMIGGLAERWDVRSEEHTSELQSLMRSSYAVFCLNKTTTRHKSTASQQKI